MTARGDVVPAAEVLLVLVEDGGWMTAGAERAAATVAGKWRRTAPTLGVVFLKGLDVGEQFFLRCPAAEVEAQHLVGASGRLAACPQADQQAGDDAQVQLDGDPVGAGREQMATTQNAFEPAEEQFRLPAIAVSQGDPFGVQVEATAGQQQD